MARCWGGVSRPGDSTVCRLQVIKDHDELDAAWVPEVWPGPSSSGDGSGLNPLVAAGHLAPGRVRRNCDRRRTSPEQVLPPGSRSAGETVPCVRPESCTTRVVPFGPTVSVIVVGGIAAGVALPVDPAAAAALAIAAASAAVCCDRAGIRRGAIVASLLAAAAAYGAVSRAHELAHPLATWFDRWAPDGRGEEPVTIDGTLVEDATITDTGVRLLIGVVRVQDGGGWTDCAGTVQANVSGTLAAGRASAWRAGRRIRAPVLLRKPPTWRDPGAPPVVWQRLRRPFDLSGSIKSALVVTVARGPWWREAAAAIRRHVRDAVEQYVAPHSRESAAVVAAVLIGDRAGLSADVRQRLQIAGTYHVIVISGGHVALLVALCVFVVRLAIRPPRASAIVALVMVLAYGAVVTGGPSVTRAVLGACVYLTLGLAGVVPRARHVLALVALVVTVVDPVTVLDIGAWLSFGATLGIVLDAGRCARWLSAPLQRMPVAPRAIATGLAGLLAATLCVEAVLLPVTASAFGRISLAGLGLNFVAVPAMAVAQGAGLATAIFSGWWAEAARCAGYVAHVAVRVLVGSADLVRVAPWVSWRVPPSGVIWVMAYYGGLALALHAGRRRGVRLAGAAAALLACGIITTGPAVGRARPQVGWLRMTMLDVGQGDAIAVQFPGGHSLLVDAGGTSDSFDIGSRVVTPALWALGVRRLDWLAVTHPDLDHIGGARSVAADLAPREIWEGVPVPANREWQRLRAAARVRGMVWRRLQAGDSLDVDGTRIEVLHPPVPDWERQTPRNDDSLVLEVTYGDVELLLTGDVGHEFEDHPDLGPLRPLRILKVAHHGSATSSAAAFLGAFRPELALVSAGEANPFGHPVPRVLARLAAVGAEVFRTDRDGAIAVETDGRVVHVRAADGRTWRLSTG
jgi:competence protein ComEC